MVERKNLITIGGKPLTLTGNEIKVGDKAPDFTVVDQNLSPVTLQTFKGKICILSTVPSLDTETCSLETKRFNKEASQWKDQVDIITVSLDLPFAQKRWCGAENVEQVHVFSDYQKREVGEKYGVLIKELQLLARAIFLIDAAGTVKYIQLVNEVSKEPDYGIIKQEVQKLLQTAKR